MSAARANKNFLLLQGPLKQCCFFCLFFFMNHNAISCCMCRMWSSIFHSCLVKFIYVFYSYENEGAWFCFSVHFTVDELPDRLCQHGVLRSPGENRAGGGGVSDSGWFCFRFYCHSAVKDRCSVSVIAFLLNFTILFRHLSLQAWICLSFLSGLLFNDISFQYR